MAWIQPKTDWAITDRFNATDYNRIKNNLNYLHDYAERLYDEFEIIDMGADKGYSDYPYAREINNMEGNLETINLHVYKQNIGSTATFYSNGAFIQWSELNRLESGILSIYSLLSRQQAGLITTEFRLGNMKGVKV